MASCLATSTGWRPGSTATPVPTLSRVVQGQRVRHADERVHRRSVDHFRQPQGIDPGLLQGVHRRAELIRDTGLAEGDADSDFMVLSGMVLSDHTVARGRVTAQGRRLGDVRHRGLHRLDQVSRRDLDLQPAAAAAAEDGGEPQGRGVDHHGQPLALPQR